MPQTDADLAEKLAIDFAEDLVSAKLLLPLEEDFPVLGGKTLRLNAGVGMAYHRDKPVIILKGISIMGISTWSVNSVSIPVFGNPLPMV